MHIMIIYSDKRLKGAKAARPGQKVNTHQLMIHGKDGK